MPGIQSKVDNTAKHKEKGFKEKKSVFHLFDKKAKEVKPIAKENRKDEDLELLDSESKVAETKEDLVNQESSYAATKVTNSQLQTKSKYFRCKPDKRYQKLMNSDFSSPIILDNSVQSVLDIYSIWKQVMSEVTAVKSTGKVESAIPIPTEVKSSTKKGVEISII